MKSFLRKVRSLFPHDSKHEKPCDGKVAPAAGQPLVNGQNSQLEAEYRAIQRRLSVTSNDGKLQAKRTKSTLSLGRSRSSLSMQRSPSHNGNNNSEIVFGYDKSNTEARMSLAFERHPSYGSYREPLEFSEAKYALPGHLQPQRTHSDPLSFSRQSSVADNPLAVRRMMSVPNRSMAPPVTSCLPQKRPSLRKRSLYQDHTNNWRRKNGFVY
eukprot:comp7783_c0_seq1/m.3403 comp7783_c0_seq1/g.3403  ORF comp7783_c0_seq1/g.3403 comp7783_c0_seq1/m.3403 type:complete len:212 (-) comp7783_c0_seq1:351-986(-)